MKKSLLITVLCLFSYKIFAATPTTANIDEIGASVMQYFKAHPDQIGDLVISYLKNNPDKMIDLLESTNNSMHQKQLQGKVDTIKNNINFLADASHRVGAKDAKIRLLFFFDWQCSWCAKEVPILMNLVNTHKDFAVYFIPIDVFGPQSVYANQVSLYAASVNKFLEFYNTMHQDGGKNVRNHVLTDKYTDKVAKQIGLDIDTMKNKYFLSAQFNNYNNKLNDIVNALQIQATPYMVILNNASNEELSDKNIGFINSYIDQKSFDNVFQQLDNN